MVNTALDNASLNFNSEMLLILNACLALIMFGIAIGIKPQDFKELLLQPKKVIIGLSSQYILLPFLTYLLVLLLKPHPGLAMGMFLVAACPGGNVSNFFTALAKGNIALSVSLSLFSTLFAAVMTPLILSTLSSLYPPVQHLLREVDISFWSMARVVFTILVLPVIAGILFRWKFNRTAMKITRPLRILSFLILIGFIVGALSANLDQFMSFFGHVFWIVLLHNGAALIFAYAFSRGLTRNAQDARSISIETGIQNTGLGLVIIFTFFEGYGPMAIIAAWWGVWHILSGTLVARIFATSKRL